MCAEPPLSEQSGMAARDMKVVLDVSVMEEVKVGKEGVGGS